MKSTKAVSLTSRCPKFCPKKLQPLKFLLKFQMATSCMLNLYYNAIANTYYNKKASRLLAWLCELFLLKKSWWYSNYNVAIAQLYNVLKSESLHKQDKYTPYRCFLEDWEDKKHKSCTCLLDHQTAKILSKKYLFQYQMVLLFNFLLVSKAHQALWVILCAGLLVGPCQQNKGTMNRPGITHRCLCSQVTFKHQAQITYTLTLPVRHWIRGWKVCTKKFNFWNFFANYITLCS